MLHFSPGQEANNHTRIKALTQWDKLNDSLKPEGAFTFKRDLKMATGHNSKAEFVLECKRLFQCYWFDLSVTRSWPQKRKCMCDKAMKKRFVFHYEFHVTLVLVKKRHDSPHSIPCLRVISFVISIFHHIRPKKKKKGLCLSFLKVKTLNAMRFFFFVKKGYVNAEIPPIFFLIAFFGHYFFFFSLPFFSP